MMPSFSESSLKALSSCDMRLQEIAHAAIVVIDFKVVQGHRNQADQEKAFVEGKTKLHWPNGNHNKFPSLAMDIAPVHYDTGKGDIDYEDLLAFGRAIGVIQAIANQKGVKLRFGADWDGDGHTVNRDKNEHLMDAPHVEIVQ